MEIIREMKEVEWKILNFSSLSEENSVVCSSSNFSFCNEYWYLRLYPNGRDQDSTGYISLFLRTKSCGSPIKIEYTLGLKTLSGQNVSVKYEYTFTKAEEGRGCYKLCLRSQIFQEKADLLSNDVITVSCSLKFPTSVETPSKDYLPESSKILTDFKELFLNQEECDVVIKVNDREFSAHKAVLIARSSVFKSTFRNDMKEKRSGSIDIKDCDPTSFSDFLCYLYCEDLDNLSDDNVFSLFVTADKYDVTDLKAKCIEFIKNNLSVDTFCDAITLALQYSETELIKLATDFFAKNLQKIIVTVKWQSFLAENPTWCNELFIKALVTDKNTDS